MTTPNPAFRVLDSLGDRTREYPGTRFVTVYAAAVAVTDEDGPLEVRVERIEHLDRPDLDNDAVTIVNQFGMSIGDFSATAARNLAAALLAAAHHIDEAADASWSECPVDSTTRACCGGIGTHTRECGTQ